MPQLEITTFYLQVTTVWIFFFSTLMFTITYIIPYISISLFIREYLFLELEEILEWSSFNQFRYLNLNISIISSFLEINLLLIKNLFSNALYLFFSKDILVVNFNIENNIFNNLKKKNLTLIKITKLK